MELPPLDHAGWGRLLATVMESDRPAIDGVPRDGGTETDAVRLRRREAIERARVLESETDVYA